MLIFQTLLLDFQEVTFWGFEAVVVAHIVLWGLYIHNDFMLSLGRPDDMFSDESIQLRPILSNFLSSHLFSTSLVSNNFSLSLGYQGTADF